MSTYKGDTKDYRNKKDKELSKEELMKKVLGKRREILLPSGEDEQSDSLINESSEKTMDKSLLDIQEHIASIHERNSKKIQDVTLSHALKQSEDSDRNEIEKTVEDSAKILDDISEDFDISALRAEIERDFGVFPSFKNQNEKENMIRNRGSKSDTGRGNISKRSEWSNASASHFSSSEQLPSNSLNSSAFWKDCSREQVSSVMNNLMTKVKQTVLGQDEAVEKLVVSFLRPYLLQPTSSHAIRNAVYISGSRGSGKHFVLNEAIRSLEKILLNRTDAVTLDMSNYAESSKKNVFLQDVYSALVSDKPFLVIEKYHLASSVVNTMMGDLVKNGNIRLDSRYVLKNGSLQETEKTLHSQYLSELSGNGKFIVFISEKKAGELVKVYGKDVAEKVVDVVRTIPFSRELAERILLGVLSQFEKSVAHVLQAEVLIDTSFKTALLDLYDTFHGVHSFLDVLDDLERKISENAIAYYGKKTRLFASEGVFQQETDGVIRVLSSKNAELIAVKEDIAKIVGLEMVKNHLEAMEHFVAASAIRRKRGLRAEEIARHMIFTGNPGTGKTTIARIIARLMKAIGALSQGHLVEVSRADLVGRYSGHTAPLTMNVLKSAIGGVLFIDEAYSLYRGKNDSFGLEAIDTLVKGMEDYRDDLMVVLAGYSDEMDTFLSANSGLKSRFPKIIHFQDYNDDELLKIALTIAEKKDYVVDYEVLLPLKEYLGKENKRECSNGRLVRNVVEAAIVKQSGRLTGTESERELRTLYRKDFDF